MKRIILTFLASMPFFLCQAQNLLNNVDFQRLYGPYPMDWGRNLALFPHAVELLPGQGPQKQNAVRLDLSEMISYSQGGLRLVPGEQYEIGAWVRTKDFHAERSGIIIYNHGWFDEAGVIPVPADTDGEWVKVTATVICPPPNARKRSYFASSVYYSFSIYATGAAGQLDAASPFLIPLSDKAKEFSRHGVSLLDNVRLVPVSPRLEELPSKDADIDFYWPNSPDGEVRCTIYFCNGISVQKTGKLSDHRVKLHFPCLQAGPGILSAEVDRETGEGFLPAGDYAVNVLDLTPEPPIRRLNNLVSEIACRETAPGRYAFSFAEGGWMYLKTKAPEICVDGRALSGFTVDGWNEFMYRVPAGMHEITLDPAAGPPESLRKIPEIQMFAFDSKEYKEDFWKKHLLENITSPSVSSAWNPGRISRDFLLEIQRSGRSLPVNGGFHARKKYDPLQIANELRHCRGTLFGSSRQYDELDPGSPAHMVYAFAEAFWQLQDMKKPVYLWAQKGGKFFSPQWHASLISAVSNAAGGQGRILNEAYCRLWSDEKRMEEALSKYRDSVAFAKEFCPDYPKNMLMTAGAYFNPEGTILLVSNPECDPKVGMDLFYRMCAVDPVFEGLYGIGVYSIDSTDEEMVRWFGKLFRHYGIEGQKDLLSKKYGFRLRCSAACRAY